MEITWTVEFALCVTDDEMKGMADMVRDYMRKGHDQEDAIIYVVGDYLADQDDSIFYNITDEVSNQIEDALNKLLTE